MAAAALLAISALACDSAKGSHSYSYADCLAYFDPQPGFEKVPTEFCDGLFKIMDVQEDGAISADDCSSGNLEGIRYDIIRGDVPEALKGDALNAARLIEYIDATVCGD